MTERHWWAPERSLIGGWCGCFFTFWKQGWCGFLGVFFIEVAGNLFSPGMQLCTQQSYRLPRNPENQATRWGGQGSNCSRRTLRNTNPILESQPWWNVDVKGYLKERCQKNDPVSCALSSIFGPASKIKTKSKNDIWNRIWVTNGTFVKKRLDCLKTFLRIQDVPGLRTMLQIDDFYGDLWNDPANHESISLSQSVESLSLPSRNH